MGLLRNRHTLTLYRGLYICELTLRWRYGHLHGRLEIKSMIYIFGLPTFSLFSSLPFILMDFQDISKDFNAVVLLYSPMYGLWGVSKRCKWHSGAIQHNMLKIT